MSTEIISFTKAELAERAKEYLKKHHADPRFDELRMRDLGLFYAFFCELFDEKDSASGKGEGL